MPSSSVKKGGLSIAFRDVTYSVPVKTAEDGQLTILNGISGSFVPGRMAALMGPSGSGKTTLLDVLSCRKNAGTTKGSVLMNGARPSPSDIKRLVGYVEQFDTLVGELTVAQMLAYTASLKLPARTTKEERRKRVEEVIDTLDLQSCRDTVIGSALIRGISGGQGKRVNIGLALVTRPRVLLLDEPTSGLDSRTADEVVELLRRLAHEVGRTVICTIHSPTGRSFAKFDDLHMLHCGRTIYDGPLAGAQRHFESLGYRRDPDCSLPEWLVDLTSDKPHESKAMDDAYEDRFEENWSKAKDDAYEDRLEDGAVEQHTQSFSQLFEHSVAKHRSLARLDSVNSERSTHRHHYNKPPSELSKLCTLLRFRMVAHYKDGQFIGMRFGDKVIFALLILSLYFGIGDIPDSQSIASTSSLLYFISAICGYGAAAYVPSLTLERALYYRELADGCYKPITYYASKFVEEGVLASVTSLVFCIIVHFACALQGNFFVFVMTYYLTTMMGIILAYAVAAVAPSMDAANAILPSLVTVWMYFGGLFIVFDKIPVGWYWFSWTSFLRYSWGAMMLNQYQGNYLGNVPVFFGDNGQALTVLEFYGMSGSIMGSIGACLGLLAGLIAVFAAIGILGLKLVRHDKR